MTLEHRILMLIDRGVSNIFDIFSIIDSGDQTTITLWSMTQGGNADIRGTSYLRLTTAGIDRLNELDGNKE